MHSALCMGYSSSPTVRHIPSMGFGKPYAVDNTWLVTIPIVYKWVYSLPSHVTISNFSSWSECLNCEIETHFARLRTHSQDTHTHNRYMRSAQQRCSRYDAKDVEIKPFAERTMSAWQEDFFIFVTSPPSSYCVRLNADMDMAAAGNFLILPL